VLEPVQHHVELQRSHRGEHRRLVAAQVRRQDLHHALGVELVDAPPELLVLPGVLASHHGEVLGRERRDRRERHGHVAVQRVPWPQRAGVDQADHVTGIGRLHGLPVLAEHRLRVLGRERAAGRGVRQHHPARELPGTHPHERHPIPVRRVHVRLYLEHQPGERRFDRPRVTLHRGSRPRGGRQRAHRVEQAAHAEVRQRRAEQHRRRLAGQERRHVHGRADLVEQRQLLGGRLVRGTLARQGLVGAEHLLEGASRATRRPRIRGVLPGGTLDQPVKVAGDADRPVHRRRPEPDPLLDLVEQLKRLPPGPVPLVHERHHGHVPRAAHVEQLQRLRLQALRRVEQHDRAVHGLEHPVGVFGEVRVARGVEQVEHVAVVVEAQRRGGDGDASVALHGHPVRGDPAPPRLAVHRAGGVDRRRVQRQRLGQRGLARVRMADNRERPPPRRLVTDGTLRRGPLFYICHRHRGTFSFSARRAHEAAGRSPRPPTGGKEKQFPRTYAWFPTRQLMTQRGQAGRRDSPDRRVRLPGQASFQRRRRAS
jgi:hypothetical protein